MILLFKSKFIWNEPENIEYESVGSTLHPEIERLFLERGLGTVDSLKNNTNVEKIWYTPFKYKGMKTAVDRIKQAIKNNEPILVYGDYDVDGTTATAILIRAIRHLGADANFYIPHRFFEGYGPNADAFMQAVHEGYKLVITVDCGISHVEEAKLLKKHNVDLIIIDHHEPQDELPQAVAIIHPELDENYPFSHLSGAGVALKFAEALRDGQLEDDDYMLAMLGTIGDVVVLTDENRSIVKIGLSALRTTSSPGVLALLSVANVSQYEIDEETVGFTICPMLNAPGRMDDSSIVVDLLLSDDKFIATEHAQAIDRLNNERKIITRQITKVAIKQAESKDLKGFTALVLYNSDWHEGVLGIVASKIVEKYAIAVVVLTDSVDGTIKGSARAPVGFDILSALEQNKDLLVKYGGHDVAAGLSLAIENLNALEVGLNCALKGSIATCKMMVDVCLLLNEIDFTWLQNVDFLAPFGKGNKRPIVKLSDVKIKHVKRIGATKEHLKFTIHKEEHSVDAIFFGGANRFIYLTSEAKFDVLCDIKINKWNGNKKLQVHVIDIRCNDIQLLDLRNQLLDSEFAGSIEDGFIIDCVFDSKDMLRASFATSGAKNVVLKRLEPVKMPAREQFVFVYQTVKRHAPFSLTPDIVFYFEKAGIPKAMLGLIVQVFNETQLFTYERGIVSLNELSGKVDVKSAPSYISWEAKMAVYEFLEFSISDEILKFIIGDE